MANDWRNRIVGEGSVQAGELVPHPQNWRKHPQAQAKSLTASLGGVGWVQRVIVNRRSGRMLDGHLRAELARQQGADTLVPVVYVDLSDDEERTVLATLDPIAGLAVADEATLAGLVRSIEDADLRSLAGDMAQALNIQVEPEGETADTAPQIDRAEELRVTWGVESGQLWQLGEHRLIVGDCTDVAVVARVMGGERAALVVTSPPYNQQIDTFKPSGMHKEGDWVAKVGRLAYADSMPEVDYQEWQRGFLTVWYDHICDNGSAFYNHKNRYRDKQVVSPFQWLPGPFRFRQEIVWSRPGSVTQNARMFLPSDERIYWLYKGEDFYFDDTTEVKTWSTVWDIGLETNKNHAVGFPLELPRRCIVACSISGEIVADPFLGSGTTLIACENLHRRCRAVEISPAYCAVALQRYADAFPGSAIERVQDV